jgi:hypothetical protein
MFIKLPLLLTILITPLVYAKNIQIDNLDISITGNSVVTVYKDKKHIFSKNCSDYMCKIFTSDVENPKINTEDGVIVLSDDIHKLSIKNVKTFKPFYWLDHRFIKFVVSASNATGSYSEQSEYLIDTTTGAVRVDTQFSDWFKYGLSEKMRHL